MNDIIRRLLYTILFVPAAVFIYLFVVLASVFIFPLIYVINGKNMYDRSPYYYKAYIWNRFKKTLLP